MRTDRRVNICDFFMVKFEGDIYPDSFEIFKNSLVPEMPIDIVLDNFAPHQLHKLKYVTVCLKKDKDTSKVLLALLLKHGTKITVLKEITHPHGARVVTIHGHTTQTTNCY